MRKTITFNDVLIEPQYSEILTRKNISLESKLSSRITLTLPVISAPMDTVTESQMAVSMANFGGSGIIHRYNSIEDQCNQYIKSASPSTGAAIGVNDKLNSRALALWNAGCRYFCIDVAHGHHINVREAIFSLRKLFGSKITIMAGNVATPESYLDLASWGADIIRVGVGGGSICSTRLETGHGVPTLQSVLDIADTRRNYSNTTKRLPTIVADGGIKNAGDIVKAIAAGADAVMLGSMLSGTDETPGGILGGLKDDAVKIYRGMASSEAQMQWRGYTSSEEGISTTVPYKGPVATILRKIEKGMKSGLSYSGALSIPEFQDKAILLYQSLSSQNESFTHILNK